MKLQVQCWEKNVSSNNCYAMVAGFVLAAPVAAYGGSLECHGTIVSPGDTEKQLLETCGNPTSRNGADWTYAVPGSQPVLVTLGNGVVMFIRDVDEAKASTESPLGDHP